MGLFNNKKHDEAPLGGRDTLTNNGVTPQDNVGVGHGAPLAHGQPHLGYGDSSVPQNLPLHNVPTVPSHAPPSARQPVIADAVLHQPADVNDRFAGASRAPAAAFGTQMSGNRAEGHDVPINAAGNIPSQHVMNDPNRNYQAPLQESEPFEDSGIGGQTAPGYTGATSFPADHEHVRHHPGHRVAEGRRVDETTHPDYDSRHHNRHDAHLGSTNVGTTGATSAQEAHADLKEAKKDATMGNIQMLAGKVLSSQSMQAKGQAKVDRADALKVQAAHLSEAEQLEEDAKHHRRLAQGGDVANTKIVPESTASRRQRNLA